MMTQCSVTGELFCELSINMLKDKSGDAIGSVTVALDLSDLKQSLAEQREANLKLEEEVYGDGDFVARIVEVARGVERRPLAGPDRAGVERVLAGALSTA